MKFFLNINRIDSCILLIRSYTYCRYCFLVIQLIPYGPREHLLFKGFGFFQLWYQLSKTLAEEVAWKFAEECGIDLVAINPGFSIGPLIQPTPTSSMKVFLELMKGTLLQLMRIVYSVSS